ncbi:hypothetical protein L1887_22736 [Cichorium endivia]|nr:hypothetical protein L1887_22736 [Cichorium endivia]
MQEGSGEKLLIDGEQRKGWWEDQPSDSSISSHPTLNGNRERDKDGGKPGDHLTNFPVRRIGGASWHALQRKITSKFYCWFHFERNAILEDDSQNSRM